MSVDSVQGNVGANFTPNSSPSLLDRLFDLFSRIFSCFQKNTDSAPTHQPRPLTPERATSPPTTNTRVSAAVGKKPAGRQSQQTRKRIHEKKAEITSPEVRSHDVAKLKQDAQATSAEIEGKLGELQRAIPTVTTIKYGDAYLAKLEDFDRELVQAGEPKVFDKQIVQLKSILEAKRIELAQPRNRLDQAGPPPRRRRVQFASTTPTVTETPAPAPAPTAAAPSSPTSPYAEMTTEKLQLIVRMRKKQPSAPKPRGEIAELQRRGITV